MNAGNCPAALYRPIPVSDRLDINWQQLFEQSFPPQEAADLQNELMWLVSVPEVEESSLLASLSDKEHVLLSYNLNPHAVQHAVSLLRTDLTALSQRIRTRGSYPWLDPNRVGRSPMR